MLPSAFIGEKLIFSISFVPNKSSNKHNVEKCKKICYTTKRRKYTALPRKRRTA